MLAWQSFPADGHAGYTRGTLQRFAYRQVHMGMPVRIVLYAETEDTARETATVAFREIARLDNIFSNYLRRSELSRIGATVGGPPIVVSEDLYFVLDRAQTLARQTGGAFDVTAGPLTRLWREAIASQRLPDPTQIERARQRTGHRKLALDSGNRAVTLAAEGMELDLGGIAKGYVLDRALVTLRGRHHVHVLVEAGGDIVAGSAPPGRTGWRIAVPHLAPAAGTRHSAAANEPDVPAATCELELEHAAISTSGDRMQFVEIGGRRYSHTVDPRSGVGLTSRRTATVVAPDGITADSLSTALTLLDADEATELLKRYRGVRAAVVVAPSESGPQTPEADTVDHCSVLRSGAGGSPT
jgi:thiamine biosynthesis lipoprotein